jgi:hypothetical protein
LNGWKSGKSFNASFARRKEEATTPLRHPEFISGSFAVLQKSLYQEMLKQVQHDGLLFRGLLSALQGG